MSGGVGEVPAKILLCGGAFALTKNPCPQASESWLCQGVEGVLAWILLSGEAIEPTKNQCPGAAGSWQCQGGPGGSRREFC